VARLRVCPNRLLPQTPRLVATIRVISRTAAPANIFQFGPEYRLTESRTKEHAWREFVTIGMRRHRGGGRGHLINPSSFHSLIEKRGSAQTIEHGFLDYPSIRIDLQ